MAQGRKAVLPPRRCCAASEQPDRRRTAGGAARQFCCRRRICRAAEYGNRRAGMAGAAAVRAEGEPSPAGCGFSDACHPLHAGGAAAARTGRLVCRSSPAGKRRTAVRGSFGTGVRPDAADRGSTVFRAISGSVCHRRGRRKVGSRRDAPAPSDRTADKRGGTRNARGFLGLCIAERQPVYTFAADAAARA